MILVNINPAYRTHELALRAGAVGLPDARRRAGVQDERLRRRWSTRCARRCPRSSALRSSTARLGRVAGAGVNGRRRELRERGAELDPSTTRSTSSTRRARPASPRARRSRTATSSTTATSSGRLRLHRARPRLRPGPLLPLLRHGHGQPRVRRATAPASSCPRTRSNPRPCSRRSRRSAAPTSTACPRCSSPSSSTRTSTIRSLQPANGDHGRRAVPGRGHDARSVDEMHMDEVTIGYGMTETSPVSTQTARRRPDRAARRRPSAACTRTSRSRSSTRDSGETAAARRAGRALHARLQRDARLLGRPGARPPRRSTPTAGCTPATSPSMDDEGYVSIVGRIKDMIIRGGENVYPREIEEFLYARPRSCDVAGDRRPRRALRRRDHGLGQRARGRSP